MAAGHEGQFLGYAWIVGNFDGIAGTRKVVDNMTGMFNASGDLSPSVDHNGGGIKTMKTMMMTWTTWTWNRLQSLSTVTIRF